LKLTINIKIIYTFIIFTEKREMTRKNQKNIKENTIRLQKIVQIGKRINLTYLKCLLLARLQTSVKQNYLVDLFLR
jgi:hypothetical protein